MITDSHEIESVNEAQADEEMEEHQKNGLAVGRWLEQHPCVVSVRHPGLPSHPQHELVTRQCYGHSGMMSFYLKGGLQESKAFLSALKVRTGGQV